MRRLYRNNPKLSIATISKSIGRSTRTVVKYISDLKAVFEQEMDIKMHHMVQLGIPQQRVSYILDIPQRTLSNRIEKLSEMINPIKADLAKGFSVSQIAEIFKVPHHIEWVNHFWYGRFSFNVPLIINC